MVILLLCFVSKSLSSVLIGPCRSQPLPFHSLTVSLSPSPLHHLSPLPLSFSPSLPSLSLYPPLSPPSPSLSLPSLFTPLSPPPLSLSSSIPSLSLSLFPLHHLSLSLSLPLSLSLSASS